MEREVCCLTRLSTKIMQSDVDELNVYMEHWWKDTERGN